MDLNKNSKINKVVTSDNRVLEKIAILKSAIEEYEAINLSTDELENELEFYRRRLHESKETKKVLN
jgi:hypothetical protein